MATPRGPEPVKHLLALLWADARARDAARERAVRAWGPIDHEGPDHPFDATDYYEEEMGGGLMRRLVSFERLASPDELVDRKLEANRIELELLGARGRLVNLDVGYLDTSKVVLASGKFAGQKIHLGRGVWADPVCRYRAGGWETFDWTFPDFRDGRYGADLLEIRALYRAARRAAR